MKISPNNQCPCGSLKKYKKCCKPFHDGSNPKKVEELMRSRYCAYSLNKETYIIETTHPNNQDYTLDTYTWKKDIKSFCEHTNFEKLEIYEIKEGQDESFIKFRATLKQDNQDASFTENSRFLKVKEKWLYVDATFTE